MECPDGFDEDEDGDFGPLTEAAIAMHELYLSLLDGGFEEREALRILAMLITEQGFSE